MSVGIKHHGEEIERERSFSEAAMEVLEWQKAGYTGGTFEASEAIGKNELRETFGTGKVEAKTERLLRILDFLVTRMKMDDGGALQAALNELKGVGKTSVVPLKRKAEPPEILRNLLSGEYDKRIERGDIAGKGQIYTIALFLYMNTTGDSEEVMTETLSHLLAQFDDPRVSRHDMGIDGLRAAPFLEDLCATAIGKRHLQQRVRARTEAILEREMPEGSGERGVGKSNLNRVIPPAA